MIKQIIVNGRTVPVPVPLATLHLALCWISETLSSSDQALTRVVFNGEDLDLDRLYESSIANLPLTTQTRLEVCMDAPIDLAIQSLEALTNLSSVIERSLRPLAVECWGLGLAQRPKDFENVQEDLDLIGDLLNHFRDLVDPKFGDVRNFCSLSQSFHQNLTTLRMAGSQSDWRAVSKILLNKLEPQISELMIECVRIESHLLEVKSQNPVSFSLKTRSSDSARQR